MLVTIVVVAFSVSHYSHPGRKIIRSIKKIPTGSSWEEVRERLGRESHAYMSRDRLDEIHPNSYLRNVDDSTSPQGTEVTVGTMFSEGVYFVAEFRIYREGFLISFDDRREVIEVREYTVGPQPAADD